MNSLKPFKTTKKIGAITLITPNLHALKIYCILPH